MPQEPWLVVIDASVVLKWQLDDEEYIPQATALRNDKRFTELIWAGKYDKVGANCRSYR